MPPTKSFSGTTQKKGPTSSYDYPVLAPEAFPIYNILLQVFDPVVANWVKRACLPPTFVFFQGETL